MLRWFQSNMKTSQTLRRMMETIIKVLFWILTIAFFVGFLVGCAGVQAAAIKEELGESGVKNETAGAALPSHMSQLLPSMVGIISVAILIVVVNLTTLVNLRYAIQLKVESDEIVKAVLVLLASKAAVDKGIDKGQIMTAVKKCEKANGPSVLYVIIIIVFILVSAVGFAMLFRPGVSGVILMSSGAIVMWWTSRTYASGVKTNLHEVQRHFKQVLSKFKIVVEHDINFDDCKEEKPNGAKSKEAYQLYVNGRRISIWMAWVFFFLSFAFTVMAVQADQLADPALLLPMWVGVVGIIGSFSTVRFRLVRPKLLVRQKLFALNCSR